VITTNKRPVPLEHYLWVSNDRYKIVDNRSHFLMEGYQSAMQASKQKQAPHSLPTLCTFRLLSLYSLSLSALFQRQAKTAGAAFKAVRAGGMKQANLFPALLLSHISPHACFFFFFGLVQQLTKWVKMIHQLRIKGLLPVVVFTFSKKKCEVTSRPSFFSSPSFVPQLTASGHVCRMWRTD